MTHVCAMSLHDILSCQFWLVETGGREAFWQLAVHGGQNWVELNDQERTHTHRHRHRHTHTYIHTHTHTHTHTHSHTHTHTHTHTAYSFSSS